MKSCVQASQKGLEPLELAFDLDLCNTIKQIQCYCHTPYHLHASCRVPARFWLPYLLLEREGLCSNYHLLNGRSNKLNCRVHRGRVAPWEFRFISFQFTHFQSYLRSDRDVYFWQTCIVLIPCASALPQCYLLKMWQTCFLSKHTSDLPLVDSSHDAGWWPKRQLGTKNNTQEELVWLLYIWVSWSVCLTKGVQLVTGNTADLQQCHYQTSVCYCNCSKVANKKIDTSVLLEI